VVVLLAGASGYWALERYVFEHVEIADVAAYEAAARASGSGATVDDASDAADAAGATDAAAADAAGTGDAEPVITETSYTSDSMTITISKVVEGSGSSTVTYYVADVVLDDATDLLGGFANNQFGTNVVAYTSDIAESLGAVFAINGDYNGFRDTGIVIRNGVLYRDDGARTGLAIYADGTMAIYDETETTGEQLLADGVWNTLSFGPALVEDGQVVEGIDEVEIDTNFGNHSIQGDQPRTAIGLIDTNHFVFVAVDGRAEGYSKGVSMTELAQIFADLGATTAYNLDGGGSTAMWFDGELVNDPLGEEKERGTSDILYLAAEEAS
jgi:exopolysaccharide biosynthesis protein